MDDTRKIDLKAHGLEALVEKLQELEEAKRNRRRLRKELKEEVAAHPSHESIYSDLSSARERMKILTIEVGSDSGLKAEVDDAGLDVNALKEIVSSLTVELIEAGVLSDRVENEAGSYTITPKVSVSFQMKLI